MGHLTRGTTKLHVDWGGYQVLLGLPIDPNKVHRSDHVVIVDMPLPAWGETKLTCHKVTQPLDVSKDARENGVGSP